MDQSDTGSAGIFSRRTNRTHDTRVYSHDGGCAPGVQRNKPARRARWTNQMQGVRIYSDDGPIGHRKRGYILTTEGERPECNETNPPVGLNTDACRIYH
eukprot:1209232-Pyramimonas_sp.AAC.1